MIAILNPITPEKAKKIIKMRPNHFRQTGAVLVVSLVFLIALTAVASALMLNSTTDMKMSGASEMRTVAEQEAFAAMDELIFQQSEGNSNSFTLPINLYKSVGTVSVLDELDKTNGDVTSASIQLSSNVYGIEIPCPRQSSDEADGGKVSICNVLEVSVNKIYGRKMQSTIQVRAGIAQELGLSQ